MQGADEGRRRHQARNSPSSPAAAASGGSGGADRNREPSRSARIAMGQVAVVTSIRVAIVGLGKIARDQHIPAIAGTQGIELPAIPTPNPPTDAVALCTPPQVRQAQAAAALRAGKHVLLEKPPGATVSELGPLVAAARQTGRTLFATWHSRFASAVEPARSFLAGRQIKSVVVEWKEDVRVWHPGQAWIWEPGGLGVFDPGINALSILTRILPRPFFLIRAELSFPQNRAAPIAADLVFSDDTGLPIRAEFDWRQAGPQTSDISVDTDAGPLALSSGGSHLVHDGHILVDEKQAEYRGLYRRFVELIANGVCDVGLSPLVHAADAFMLGPRRRGEPSIQDLT